MTEINQSADDSYAGYEAESSRNSDLSWIDRIPVEVETHLTKTERALLDALRQGKIAAAGLDVFHEEPLKPDDPILTLENVVLPLLMSGTAPSDADSGVPGSRSRRACDANRAGWGLLQRCPNAQRRS